MTKTHYVPSMNLLGRQKLILPLAEVRRLQCGDPGIPFTAILTHDDPLV